MSGGLVAGGVSAGMVGAGMVGGGVVGAVAGVHCTRCIQGQCQIHPHQD